MKHLCVLQVEQIPLHAARRAGWQASHIVLVFGPSSLGEKLKKTFLRKANCCLPADSSQASHQVEVFDNLGRRICKWS